MGGWEGSDGGGLEALVCTLGSRSGGNLWDREYDVFSTLQMSSDQRKGFLSLLPFDNPI